MSIQGFIFDLDGVITQTADLHFLAWKKMAEKIGINLNDEMEIKLRGVERKKCLEIILQNNNTKIDLTNQQKQEYLDYKNSIYVESLSTLNKSKILPNMLENLQYLKENHFKIGLASVSKNATKIVEKLGIIDLFDNIVDIDKIINSKPNPELFLTAVKNLRLNPNQVVVVDDSIIGIQAIKNGKMKSVGIGVDGDYSFKSTNQFNIDEIQKIVKENNHEEV